MNDTGPLKPNHIRLASNYYDSKHKSKSLKTLKALALALETLKSIK